MPLFVLKALRTSRLFWRFFRYYTVLVVVFSVAVASLGSLLGLRFVQQEIERIQTLTSSRLADRLDGSFTTLKGKVLTALYSNAPARFSRTIETRPRTVIVHDYPSLESYQDLSNVLGALFLHDDLVDSYYLYFPAHQVVVTGSAPFQQDLFFHFENQFEDPHQVSEVFRPGTAFALTGSTAIARRDYITGAVSHRKDVVSMITAYPLYSRRPDYYLVLNIDTDRLGAQIAPEPGLAVGAAIMDNSGAEIAASGRAPLDRVDLRSKSDSPVAFSTLRDPDLRMLVTRVVSEATGWSYLTFVDFRQIRRTVLGLAAGVGGLLVFLVVSGVLLSALLSRQIASPLEHITSSLAGSLAPPYQEQSWDELSEAERLATTIAGRHSELRRQLEVGAPLVNEMVLIRLLRGRLAPDDLLRGPSLAALEAGRGSRQVVCVSLRPRHGAWSRLSARERQMAVDDVRAAMREALAGAAIADAEVKKGLLAWVIRSPGEPEATSRLIARPLERALRSYEPVFGCSAAIGPPVEASRELPGSYEAALALLSSSRLDGAATVFCYWEAEEAVSPESFLSTEDIEKIDTLARLGRPQNLQEVVLRILGDHLSPASRIEEAVELAQDLLNAVFRASSGRAGSDVLLGKYPRYARRIAEIATEQDLLDCFVELCSDVARVTSAGMDGVFQEVVREIERDYANRNLSLEYFADKHGMSMGHFSRSFKRETGKGFVDFLNLTRLKHAKRLLIETDFRVSEVAEAVGYGNTTSFIAIFKKYAGVTPGRLRGSPQGHPALSS